MKIVLPITHIMVKIFGVQNLKYVIDYTRIEDAVYLCNGSI